MINILKHLFVTLVLMLWVLPIAGLAFVFMLFRATNISNTIVDFLNVQTDWLENNFIIKKNKKSWQKRK